MRLSLFVVDPRMHRRRLLELSSEAAAKILPMNVGYRLESPDADRPDVWHVEDVTVEVAAP